MQYAVTATLLLVLISASADAFELSRDSVRVFNTIDKHLKMHAENEDPVGNMDEIDNWLNSVDFKDKFFIDVSTEVRELRTMSKPGHCDRETYDRLRKIVLSANVRCLHEPRRRIEKLVQYYVLEHAKACHSLYPELIAEMKPKVESFWPVIESLAMKTIPEELVGKCSVFAPENEQNILDNLHVYDVLLEVAKNDPNYASLTSQGGDVDEEKVRSLFEKHILAPCETINEQVGEAISGITWMDMSVSAKTGFDDKCIGYSTDAFVLDICNDVTKSEKYRAKLIQNLLGDVANRGN